MLDWELSTIGHPLMDVVYLISPFLDDYNGGKKTTKTIIESPYTPEKRKTNGIPDPELLLDHYAQLVGHDLRQSGKGRDWEVAIIFYYIRGATITHGIQARTISGQASSEFSHLYFANTKKSIDAAYERVRKLKEQHGKPRL